MLLAMALVVSAALISGCGSSGSVVSSGSAGTTLPGTYNLSITGVAGNDTHTLVVTLIVQ
jgi:hypothetical protein